MKTFSLPTAVLITLLVPGGTCWVAKPESWRSPATNGSAIDLPKQISDNSFALRHHADQNNSRVAEISESIAAHSKLSLNAATADGRFPTATRSPLVDRHCGQAFSSAPASLLDLCTLLTI